MTALRKNRVNHAYLFSGPRGCGKTTSARILARCLNCAEGPTDTPCGKCPSCVELARGGSGSLDVIEIDAASHGGVDDARDLRERATYAPVRDRYKIFIIDEAHMVTSAGFNALLKIVEEPPEHIKFIFATTEPDKVIGTIRSRTHHYPFRLVPPEPLMAYLELLCTQENVPVAPGVLSLVIRAGGGSVRDSLSVLDQLMAGAGPNGLDYELAVALLGYTHASLLDDVVEAVAASDAATVFRAVDRVIQTGHDPRRFVEDLLERFRDLIIVQAMPESAQSILRGMPADQIARMQNQAHNLGAAELSRAADVTNTALTEMTGATSPRLHLELLCARILLPSSEQTERGIAARIDRVERRLNYAGNDVGAPAAAPARLRHRSGSGAAAPAPAAPVRSRSRSAAARGSSCGRPRRRGTGARRRTGPGNAHPAARQHRRLARRRARRSQPGLLREGPGTPGVRAGAAGAGGRCATAAPAPPARLRPARLRRAPAPAAAGPEPAGRPGSCRSARRGAGAGSGPDVEVLRRAWPEILQTLTKIKRSTWALVEPNAQVGHFEDHVLTLAFTTSGLAGAFGRADHSENLRQAIHKTIGIECQINAVAGGSNSAASSEPNPKAPVSRDVPATSTDADWGLPPAEAPAQPPRVASPTAAADGAASPAPSGPAAAPRPVTPAAPAPGCSVPSVPPAPDAPPQAPASPAPSPAPADCCPRGNPRRRSSRLNEQPGASPEAAGSYAYPDDDWGPPRDEDAPPLDEEPPMDWDPSAPAAAGPSRPAAAPATRRPKEAAAPARSGAASQASPRPMTRPPRRRTPPTTRGPAPSSRPRGSGRSARTPMSGATRRRSPRRPSPRLSRNRRTTNPRRPRSRTTPQQCRLPPRMSRRVLIERLGRLRGVGAGRRRIRSSLGKRCSVAPPAAPSAACRAPASPAGATDRRAGKASTSGCPTAPKPKPDAPRLRPAPPPPPRTSRTSPARTTKRSRNRASSDAPPSNVSWAENWLKSGHWTEARCRRASSRPAGPSARHHPKRTRTLCTKVQFKS